MTTTPGNDPFASPTPGQTPQGYGSAAPADRGQAPIEGLSGWGQPPRSESTNTLAVVAFVMAFVFSPVGLVLGFVARNQIKTSGEKGNGLALAAIIISALSLLLGLLLIVGGLLFAASTAVVVEGLPVLR